MLASCTDPYYNFMLFRAHNVMSNKQSGVNFARGESSMQFREGVFAVVAAMFIPPIKLVGSHSN